MNLSYYNNSLCVLFYVFRLSFFLSVDQLRDERVGVNGSLNRDPTLHHWPLLLAWLIMVIKPTDLLTEGIICLPKHNNGYSLILYVNLHLLNDHKR